MESGVCTLFVKLVKISKEMDFLSISIKVEIFNSPNSVFGPSIFFVNNGTTERSLIAPFIL